ncbi:TIGR01457 family HAD-type hydrolase [Paenibacillus sp. MBLB4367]|uniref:TIGR01457 family HAD-type hydrolase n=1 Tax=Paenibacillus sp. MBLB4367 TaxID=3384767 RepID=UPI0039080DAC
MPGFLIDLDGTMYAGNRQIPHAASFIRELERRGWPYLYVTNNSSRTPEQVAAHISEVVGIEARSENVLSSAQAAAAYIAERREGRRVYAIGEAGLRQALTDAGLELVEEQPDYVVQGIDRQFTYAKLEAAVRHIAAGAVSIMTNPDHMLPGDGGLSPGAGSLGAAIRMASGIEPVVIGKPSPIIMRYAVERLGLPTAHIWAVGDNMRTDIGGGIAAGCRTALVLTGVATAANVEAQLSEAGCKPDLVCGDLAELLERLDGAAG